MRAVRTDGRDALSGTLRELAADLAISQRACRELQSEVEAFKVEIARLSAPAPLHGEQLDADQLVGGHRKDPQGGRRAQHEHTIARLSTVVLVLRRGNLALKEENASLRHELQQLHAIGNTHRDKHLTRGLRLT